MFVQFTRLNGGKVSVNPRMVCFVTDVAPGSPFVVASCGLAAAGCEIVFGEAFAVPVQEDRHSVETQLGQAVLSFASICGGN